MTKDSQRMLVSEIKKPFAFLKETEKGQRGMTEALEQLVSRGREEGREEGAWEERKVFVGNLRAAGFPFDKIVELTGSSAEEVHKIIDHIAAGTKTQLT